MMKSERGDYLTGIISQRLVISRDELNDTATGIDQ